MCTPRRCRLSVSLSGWDEDEDEDDDCGGDDDDGDDLPQTVI